MNCSRLLGTALPLLALAAGCATADAPPQTADRYLDQFIDTTANPRTDFFQYAVGKWLRDHPIPASERSWGISHVIQEETYDRLVNISKTAAGAPGASGSNSQKIGDFWSAAMDTVAIAQQGIKPLDDEFARIQAIKTKQDLLNTIAHLQHIGVGAMYGLYIFQDEKNSDRFAVHLYQGGLGLPDRDYYFDADDRAQAHRREYVTHVTRMFRLLGDDSASAAANAATVMAMETELAKASRKLEALRDPQANYNMKSIAAMASLTPSIQWREHLAEGKISGIDSVIVGQPEFFKQVEQSLSRRSIDEWKTYLRWQLVHTFAPDAGGAFDDEQFHFYGTVLNGTTEQRPRWKRMLDKEEQYLGDALGQLYVEKYFSPRTKQRYEKLTEDIFAAYRERIRGLAWMSDTTKTRALNKLDSVTRKVGYPAKWKDYASYAVDRRSHLGNVLRGNTWQSDYFIAKLHKPVDRQEWQMTPQTYNAYYNPSNNEIVLPAAIFILPGIADSLVDDAIVYAYAGGTTIGHEITHGFDDSGRQFDARGNLVNWWTPKDEAEFKRRAAGIVKQYDDYIAVDTLHVNGEATQGDNLADLGGIILGWEAFKKTPQYQKNEKLGGLSPAQRYFVGWALGWMNQIRPENLRVRVKTDVHAPSFLRVIGPVSNMEPFYEAFAVKPGDKMYRSDSNRVRVW